MEKICGISIPKNLLPVLFATCCMLLSTIEVGLLSSFTCTIPL